MGSETLKKKIQEYEDLVAKYNKQCHKRLQCLASSGVYDLESNCDNDRLKALQERTQALHNDLIAVLLTHFLSTQQHMWPNRTPADQLKNLSPEEKEKYSVQLRQFTDSSNKDQIIRYAVCVFRNG